MHPPEDQAVTELFSQTLNGGYDDEDAWRAIDALRDIATPVVFQLALDFCKSDEPLKRARGLNVLAQLGVTPENPSGLYADQRLAAALAQVSDTSEMVVIAAAWALAQMKGDKSMQALLALRHHKDAKVRHAVASGLAGEISPAAVDALIGLMQDTDATVRQSATFGLGRESEAGLADSPAIRNAFRKCLADKDDGAYLEALWALALREDAEGLKLLLARLEDGAAVTEDIDIAEYILVIDDATVPELCAALREHLAKDILQ